MICDIQHDCLRRQVAPDALVGILHHSLLPWRLRVAEPGCRSDAALQEKASCVVGIRWSLRPRIRSALTDEPAIPVRLKLIRKAASLCLLKKGCWPGAGNERRTFSPSSGHGPSS
jgi:hypothetical protein